MYHFQVDHRYTREDVYKIIGIPVDTKGGNWDTGYNKYKNGFCRNPFLGEREMPLISHVVRLWIRVN